MELSNSAHSIYHGLQAKFERRFSRGLYFLGSYTWSKSIDDQSNGTDTAIASGQYPQNPLNASLDRGLSSFDRTQVFVANAVWEIPFGRGRRWSGARRGQQRSRRMAAQRNFHGGNRSAVQRSDELRGCQRGGRQLPAESHRKRRASVRAHRSTNGSTRPRLSSLPRRHYGNAGRNILRGPGTTNLDFGLSKSVPWGKAETRRLQIRAEFFNALNHTNFGLPQNSIDSPAFGTITTAAPAREIQLGARLEF